MQKDHHKHNAKYIHPSNQPSILCTAYLGRVAEKQKHSGQTHLKYTWTKSIIFDSFWLLRYFTNVTSLSPANLNDIILAFNSQNSLPVGEWQNFEDAKAGQLNLIVPRQKCQLATLH